MIRRNLALLLLLVAICGVVPAGSVLNAFGLGCGDAAAAVTPINEGFETGFSPIWSTGGTANWSIVSDVWHSGSHSVRAPISVADPYAPSSEEMSYLETTLNLLTTQNVSFWYKVSSEADFDFLIFYIDGVEKNRWSGKDILTWRQAIYSNVPAGNHTFRWEYSKDNQYKDGSDTAWIDDIVFPNASAVLSYTINTPSPTSSGSISCQSPVDKGANSVCTITPTPGHHLDPSTFTDNDIVASVINNSYTITNVQGAHTIAGKFVLDAPGDMETFESGDFSKFKWSRWVTDANGDIKVGAATWDIAAGGYSSIYGGSFAAVSPPIIEGVKRDDEANYIETELYIPAPGVMSFRYKVSSEEGFDFLRFYIDNVEQTHIDPVTLLTVKGWSGEIPWEQESYAIDKGSHIFRWEYVKDGSTSIGEDRAWIDDIVFPGAIYKSSYSITAQVPGANGSISCVPEIVSHGSESVCTIASNPGYHLTSLSDNGVDKLLSVTVDDQGIMKYTIGNITSDHDVSGAFDINGNIENFEAGFTKFPWSTGGSTASLAWSITDQSGHSGTYGGTHSAETPKLNSGQTSYLETTLSVPLGGVISFWYKVSSEPDSDFLKFYIDGVNVEGASWSGEHDWAPVSYPVTEGTRTFRWEYSKNNADIVPSLFDKAWIDDIAFTGTAADFPVKIERGASSVIYKTTLQDAYNDAMSTDIIKLKQVSNMGGLLAANNVSVTVKGGYDNTFTSNAAMTTVGPIYINAGTVRLERITVK